MKSRSYINEIKTKSILGITQLISREIIMKIIAVAGQLLLVRLLAPSYFGTFAILSFLISTTEIFTDVGLSLAILQRKQRPTTRELTAIFTVKLLLAGIIVGVLNLLAPLLSTIYPQFSHPEVLMLRILSLTLLLKPLQSVIASLLERELRYKDIATIDVVGIFVYYFTAFFLAINSFGLWSFIIATVVKAIVELVITFIIQPWMPSTKLYLSDIKDFVKIGKYFQLGFFLTLVHNAIIPVIAGTRFSLANVGYLDWSYNTASLPRIFADNLSRVSFASFSRIQEHRAIISLSLEYAFQILSIIALYVTTIILLFGHDTIRYLIGDKWLPALPALRWYIGSIFFLNGTSLYGNALLAIGKSKSVFVVSALIIILEILISLVLIRSVGFVGIAVGFFVSRVFLFVLYIWLCEKERIIIRLKETVFINGFIMLLLLFFAFLVNQVLPSTFFFYVIKLIIVGVGYLFFLQVFFPTIIAQSLQFLKQKEVNRKRP